MVNEAVQALNYSAHAIEALRKTAADLKRTTPVSAASLLRVTELLKNAVKFILPNCCDLLAPDGLRQAHVDSMRLPFPIVAFETPWRKDGAHIERLGNFRQTVAPKRIALCWEPDPARELIPGMNSIADGCSSGGVFVLPIYWDLDQGTWLAALGGSFVPYENEVEIVNRDQLPLADRIAYDAKLEAGLLGPKARGLKIEPFCIYPEFLEPLSKTYGGRDQSMAVIMLDSHDEMSTMIQACSVINCANVTSVPVRASQALNKKRMAKGQQPFFDYKVLQLSTDKRPQLRSEFGGEHASPRMHLRRGHIRRLDGRQVWVRPTTVNAGSKLGVVSKDYAVSPRVS